MIDGLDEGLQTIEENASNINFIQTHYSKVSCVDGNLKTDNVSMNLLLIAAEISCQNIHLLRLLTAPLYTTSRAPAAAVAMNDTGTASCPACSYIASDGLGARL